jgi:ABC-2 type transport system ATP-binding protein
MDKGEIIALGKPSDVKKSVNMSVLEIYVKDVRAISRMIKENLRINSQAFGDRINILTADTEQTLNDIKDMLSKNGFSIIEHRIVEPSLENIFIHLVSNPDPDKSGGQVRK